LARKTDVEKKNLKMALLLKSIIQRKIGEHERALETISTCITNFAEFHNAYLVRGQTYLLMGKGEKALQDFMTFSNSIPG
jgi:tetratricopeptide (TPR) repeat protein